MCVLMYFKIQSDQRRKIRNALKSQISIYLLNHRQDMNKVSL